jgi:hypothetical protein
MPLRLCPVADTDDDTRDTYVALTGGYCVGTFNRLPLRLPHRLPLGHREGDWIWGAGFGHPLDDGGRVGTAREAEDAVVASFREQLARIGLAEVEGATPRLRVRKPTLPAEASWDVARYGRGFAHIPEKACHAVDAGWIPVSRRRYAPTKQCPRIARITSGDLPIGVLREVATGPSAGHWTWAISGTRHNPPDFVWNGCASSLEESQDALLWAWSTWIAWAGLRQVRAPEMSRPIRSLC